MAVVLNTTVHMQKDRVLLMRYTTIQCIFLMCINEAVHKKKSL